MAGKFNLLRRLTLFMLLFSLWKVPLPPKSEIRSLYSPLMLAEKTNILYAGDVFLTLNKGVELPSLLTAFGLLACLLGLIQIEKACRLDETCTEILQRIVRRYVSGNLATVGPGTRRGDHLC